MILELKLRKVGNSVGLVLPKEALAHMQVGEGDTVTVTDAAEGGLRLSPHKAEIARQLAKLGVDVIEAGVKKNH